MIISQNKPTIAVDHLVAWAFVQQKVENAMGGASVRNAPSFMCAKSFLSAMDIMAAQGGIGHNNRSRLEYNVHPDAVRVWNAVNCLDKNKRTLVLSYACRGERPPSKAPKSTIIIEPILDRKYGTIRVCKPNRRNKAHGDFCPIDYHDNIEEQYCEKSRPGTYEMWLEGLRFLYDKLNRSLEKWNVSLST